VPTNMPTMRELMKDPLYRAYMKRVPPAVHANTNGEPWQIWVETPSHKWLTKTFATYPEVWSVFVKKFRDPAAARDVTITSRRVFYAPPGEWYDQKVRRPRRPTPDNPKTSHVVLEPRWRQLFTWPDIDLHWCGRCRRPVNWLPLFENHHALRRQPTISPDDNFRCILCGIRWVTTPSIDSMERW